MGFGEGIVDLEVAFGELAMNVCSPFLCVRSECWNVVVKSEQWFDLGSPAGVELKVKCIITTRQLHLILTSI